MGAHVVKQYYDTDGSLIVKPYRLKDLASIFDVNVNTLKTWIAKCPDEMIKKDGKYFSVIQVRFFIEKFGLPQKLCVMAFRQAA